MKENKMIIRPVNTKVIHVHEDDQFWTVVRSYRNYDGIEPVYTIIQEDAHASPVIVQTNKKASAVNEYFGHDIITFFDEKNEL
jgi:hypothetical protein